MKPPGTPPTLIGWQERIDLPDLGLLGLPIKVDTGAKTTALHAEEIEVFTRDGAAHVRFRAGADLALFERAVHAQRAITNTSGVAEMRIVIRTPMVLAGRRWPIDVSLTDRANMRFELILGRRALRRRGILVDPCKTYLVSDRPTPERTSP